MIMVVAFRVLILYIYLMISGTTANCSKSIYIVQECICASIYECVCVHVYTHACISIPKYGITIIYILL